MAASMKILLSLTLTAMVSTSVLADITLVQDTLLNGVSSRSTMWIKGDKIRTDNDTTSSIIMDTASGDMTTLVHEQKMIIQMNTKQLHALAAQAGGVAGAAAKVETSKITATGETEKVDGYDCEIYLVENQGMVVKMWVAKGYPGQEKLREEMKVMAKMAAANAPKQPDVPGIALKTEYEQQGLKFTTRLVSLKSEPVDAARFAIPEGYKAP
jgi:hypothetical protein